MDVRNIVLILLAMGGFAVFHSLTAGSGVKRRLTRIMDERLVEGWYRLAYNAFSVITFAPVLLLMAVLPDRVLYTVTLPYRLLLVSIQAIGLLGFLWGLLSFDLQRFMGLRQALAYLGGELLPLPVETLQEGEIYGIVRHPLYSCALLMLWPMPVMTLNLLIFNIGVSLYLVIGSRIEEQRLLNVYGEVYRRYRQRVPWLIPWPFRRHRSG